MLQNPSYYEVNAISNSALSLFNYDIELFYKVYISKELPQKQSSSLLLGTLVHNIILEPDKLENYKIIKNVATPSGKMLDFIDHYLYLSISQPTINEEDKYRLAYTNAEYAERTKIENVIKDSNKYQEYIDLKLEMALNKDKYTYITQEEIDLAKELASVATDLNPMWDIILNKNIFDEVEVFDEREFYWIDEVTGLSLKSKLDRLIVNHTVKRIDYFDFKTDSKNPLRRYKETFEYWKTYRQIGFYNKAIMNVPEYKSYLINHWIVPIDVKTKKSTIYNVSEDYIIKGEDEINKDLKDLKWHIENNKWEYTKEQYDQFELQKMLILIP